MGFTRTVDRETLDSTTYLVQRLLDRDSGATTCRVSVVKFPPGAGSPDRLHVHKGDQLIYVLNGTVTAEIAGETYDAEAGTLVVIPAGEPHWTTNRGTEPSLHLSIMSPLPEIGAPSAVPVRP